VFYKPHNLPKLISFLARAATVKNYHPGGSWRHASSSSWFGLWFRFWFSFRFLARARVCLPRAGTFSGHHCRCRKCHKWPISANNLKTAKVPRKHLLTKRKGPNQSVLSTRAASSNPNWSGVVVSTLKSGGVNTVKNYDSF